MTAAQAFVAERIFDGSQFHHNAALLVEGDHIAGIVAAASVPDRFAQAGGVRDLIVPGFVDLQVNGGGGALFNEAPTLEGIRTICSAHAKFGTTSLLPTLITDRPEVRDQAIAAGADALRFQVPGYLGLHLEGPHLSIARKGAHFADYIRPLDDADLSALQEAASRIGKAMTTIAPENVSPQQVQQLVEAGWRVSLGHTNCKAVEATGYFATGASMATHLFNAMSQLGNREPGLVGAALTTDEVSCGLIADGIHVDPLSMIVAINAKRGNGQIFFVTDAMSPTGTDVTEFELSGRTIYRRDGRLTLEDGTLAGADIDMIAMVRRATTDLQLPLEDALRMASLYPANAIGANQKGHLEEGADADFLELTPELELSATWIAGNLVFAAANEGAH